MPGADVKHLAFARQMRHGFDQRRHRVGDIDEIARLRAVAENGHVPSLGQLLAEIRHHPGIGRMRALARAEHVEEAQARRRHAVGGCRDMRVQLAARFVGAARRNRIGRQALIEERFALVAIDRRRRSINHRHGHVRPGAARSIEHIDGAGQVGAVRLEPAAVALDHGRDGGQMKTAIDIVDGAAQHHRIGDVALDEFDAARQVFHAPMRQIVEHAHHMSARHQGLGQMRADESATAGDEEEPARRGHLGPVKRLRGGIAVEHPLSSFLRA